MAEPNSTLVYLDTNVYARPFDDQTHATILKAANAFQAIIMSVNAGCLQLLSSDILAL